MVHQGVGWCDTTLDDLIWDGRASAEGELIVGKTAEDCWSACQLAHPNLQEPRHKFWNDGDQTRCYCQEGCPPCMQVSK